MLKLHRCSKSRRKQKKQYIECIKLCLIWWIIRAIMGLLENQFAQQRLSRMIKRRKGTFNKRTGSPPGETEAKKVTRFFNEVNGIFTDIFNRRVTFLYLAQSCREQVNQSFWHFPGKLGRAANPEEYRSEQILGTLDEEGRNWTVNTIELINQKQLYAWNDFN